MICNGDRLLLASPIAGMLGTKEKTYGVSHGLSEAGYDIRIKQDICFRPELYHNTGSLVRAAMVRIDDQPYQTGRFIIASAIERFIMPDNLVGIVHDKSSWARRGLSVFNTVIEPGFRGGLTLELVYHGQEILHIPAGSGIAQVVFHELTEEARYRGKYQNQSDEPVAAIFS